MLLQDTELTQKAKKTSGKMSENMHIFANDPSLAFFRIQEHVGRVLPPVLDKRLEIVDLQHNLQGHCYDLEYAVGAVKEIERSEQVIIDIQESIKSSIFLKQQLKFQELKKKSKRDGIRGAVYKRFSANLALDLPEFPNISDVVRDTSQRMETIMTANRGGTATSSSSTHTQNATGELQRSHTTLH